MLLLVTFAGYFLGSIPEAWLITELVAHTDLRTLGSGNVGVMNTLPNTIMAPAVIGKSSGHARYLVVGSKCRVQVEYDWGTAALKWQ